MPEQVKTELQEKKDFLSDQIAKIRKEIEVIDKELDVFEKEDFQNQHANILELLQSLGFESQIDSIETYILKIKDEIEITLEITDEDYTLVIHGLEGGYWEELDSRCLDAEELIKFLKTPLTISKYKVTTTEEETFWDINPIKELRENLDDNQKITKIDSVQFSPSIA